MHAFQFNQAIVRTPGRSIVDGLRAHGAPAPDRARIMVEHAAYLDALRQAGVRVQVLPALEAYPDSMFVEDPALVFAEFAVSLTLRANSRAGEAALLYDALSARFSTVQRLADGHVDGGDVLVLGDEVLVGVSQRTDRQGAESLAALLDQRGLSTRVVATPASVLHLKSGCSLVDEDTVLATAEVAAITDFGTRRVLVTPHGEEGGANVLRVNGHLLVSRMYPRLVEMLAREDLQLLLMETTEIAKVDAGLTCMSLRWQQLA